MDLSVFRNRLLGFGLSTEDVDRDCSNVASLERWLEKRGVTPDSASERDLRAYLKRLIQRNKNSIDRMLSILFYYETTNRVDLELYMSAVVDGSQDMDDFLERVAGISGNVFARRLEKEIPQPPLGTDPAHLPRYTARLIRYLLLHMPEADVRRALDEHHEGLIPIQYGTERDLYRAASSMDEYLLASAKLEELKCRAFQRSGSKWCELFFPKAYVDRIVLCQERLSAVRRGNTLYITQPPYLPARYIEAGTLEKKRYYTCHDPYVRASLLTGTPSISIVWCERCVSRCRRQYEHLLERPLHAEVVECALLGDTACRFAVYLEQEGRSQS
ncbi:MAG: hypothetical protein LLF75_11780 [Eubacteriales bacterium]|nr:hypothetical protein [Eubacteriales bacterium]